MSRTIQALLVCALAAACTPPDDCVEGDFTIHTRSEERELQSALGLDWYQHARSCQVGPYRVVGPLDASLPHLYIYHAETKEPEAAFGADSLSVWDSRPAPVMSLGPRTWDKGGQFLSYKGYDARRDAHVTVFDSELDGQPDFKSTHRRASQESIREVWIADGWRAHVRQGDEYGYLVDGEFFSGPGGKQELIERLKVRAKEQTSGRGR